MRKRRVANAMRARWRVDNVWFTTSLRLVWPTGEGR
jgi:hypothetical protein